MDHAPAGRARLILLGAVAPVVWGTTYVVTTELLPPDRPMTASLLRALPAGLLLLALTRQRPPRDWWGRFAVLALLNFGAFFPLLFLGAYRLPGGLAAVVGSAQPLVAALLLLLAFRQRTPLPRMLWALAAVAGVSVAVFAGTVTLDALGLAAAFAGTAVMAAGVVLTRRWGLPDGMSGLAATGWQLTLGGLMIAPLVPLLDTGAFVLDLPAVLGYAWLALPGGAIAYAAWFHAGRRVPATSLTLLIPLTPVTAAVLGLLLLDETLTGLQAAGFGLALVASLAGQLPGLPRAGLRRGDAGRSRPGGDGPHRSGRGARHGSS
ncbi:DMT family transporter [Kocuria rosea]|uniref:ABC transporter permease n=1 Tax=Kocuria rosea subsp. polaris TaxID=136273 RepID=A0A0A6VVR4_KOCRO|nr:DMT family transporter [Kocuria polaris]KHD98950.1 ABC transporter permease [Kocuria polaris]